LRAYRPKSLPRRPRSLLAEMPRAALRPAFLAVCFTFAAANPGAARPTCPVAPSDPWHTSSGCCCCSGACLYDGCPPCPCPAPLPGHKQPQCSLAKMKATFTATYKAVVAKTKPNDYPAKTALSSDGHWDWAYSTGWTSVWFPASGCSCESCAAGILTRVAWNTAGVLSWIAVAVSQ